MCVSLFLFSDDKNGPLLNAVDNGKEKWSIGQFWESVVSFKGIDHIFFIY